MRLPIPRPPVTSPALGPLRTWAVELTAYLQSIEQANAYGQKIVVLPGITDNAKATGDGIIMFDPVLKLPVVSIDGAWHPLATEQRVQDLIDASYAFGGFRLAAPVAGADITATWQRLTASDSLAPPAKGMVIDLANHRFQLSQEGVYTITVNFAFTHNNSGAARVLLVRLHSEDNTTIGGVTYIPTPGSTRATQNSLTAYLTATPALLGKWFFVEISADAGDPDYTSVEWATQAIYISKLGAL